MKCLGRTTSSEAESQLKIEKGFTVAPFSIKLAPEGCSFLQNQSCLSTQPSVTVTWGIFMRGRDTEQGRKRMETGKRETARGIDAHRGEGEPGPGTLSRHGDQQSGPHPMSLAATCHRARLEKEKTYLPGAKKGAWLEFIKATGAEEP